MATQPVPPNPSLPPVVPAYLQQQPEQTSPVTPAPAPNFYRNLGEEINQSELNKAANHVLTVFNDDESARDGWLRGWKDAAEYNGLTYKEKRTHPWEGASGVYDTALLEANCRFVSEMSTAVFGSNGPCRADVYGDLTPAKQSAAIRVADHMNWWLMTQMKGFCAETEQLNWGVGFQGVGFKKVVRNPVTGAPQSNYVRANMLFVPIGYSTLAESPRIIELMPKTKADVQRAVASGFYSKGFKPQTGPRTRDLIEEAEQRDAGLRDSQADDTDVELLEAHIELEIDPEDQYFNIGYPLPYVITIDKRTQQVGSIRRNWVDGDPEFKRRETYVEYAFMPTDQFGVYAIGLSQMLYNLARSATGLLEGDEDAATLNTTRGGLFSQDLRLKGDDLRLSPGEFKSAECTPQELKDGIWMPDYAPPDPVLFQMLGELDTRARRLAGNADLNISEMGSGQTPVGTILAIIERGIKVFTAIQARWARSFQVELKLISDIILDEMYSRPPIPEGSFNADEIKVKNRTFTVSTDDYENVQVVPTLDPDAGTISQRILQIQAISQFATQMPGPFDEVAIARAMCLAMGMKNTDDLVPPEPIVPRLDPVSENARIIVGQPVQAFKDQDHMAHLTAHQAILMNPQLQQEMQADPQAQAKLAAATAHVSEHLAFMQRVEIEKVLGFELPEQLTPEQENRLAPLIASASQQVAANPPQPIGGSQSAPASAGPNCRAGQNPESG